MGSALVPEFGGRRKIQVNIHGDTGQTLPNIVFSRIVGLLVGDLQSCNIYGRNNQEVLVHGLLSSNYLTLSHQPMMLLGFQSFSAEE